MRNHLLSEARGMSTAGAETPLRERQVSTVNQILPLHSVGHGVGSYGVVIEFPFQRTQKILNRTPKGLNGLH